MSKYSIVLVHLQVEWVPVHTVVAKESDVVESAEGDLVLHPLVEVTVLHIWNVWNGVVTSPLDGDGGVVIHQGAKTVLRVGEHQLGHPDFLLLLRRQSIQTRVCFQIVIVQP